MDYTTTTNDFNRRNKVPSAVVLPNGNPRLRHQNSYKLSNSSPSPPTLPDMDFHAKFPATESYTSLKDIIPSSPSSMLSPTLPTSTTTAGCAGMTSPTFGSGYEISIRNRLVKQAAWAYLQPTVPSSPSSSSRCVCFSGECFGPIIDVFRRISCEAVTRVYDWLVDVLWLILCR
ncbi:hypothetical protein RND81_05G010400 [Saponaria officinalis]|uniref:Uncharacterized protein n=1 Tax=Saponaria officinalis TaxID=3572 RepID=A0AAW1KSB5_SAPOF